EPVLRTREGHAVIGGVTILSIFLGVYAIRHLPFIDFRAYKIGNNIPEQMKPREQPVIEYTFEKDGKEVTSTEFLTDGYTYKSARVLNPEESTAKITDFSVTTPDGEDFTQQTFTGTKVLMIMYDVSKTSDKNIGDIVNLSKSLEGKVDMMILTASPGDV